MASKIQICNLALSHIAAIQISSLDDASKEARQCKLLYEPALRSVLRDHHWNFAKKVVALGLLTVTPTGFLYAYALPTDCVKAREIYREYPDSDPIRFEIQSRTDQDGLMLVTDEEDASLVYTAFLDIPNLYDPLFIDALSWRLASDLAQPITKTLAIQQAMLTIYRNTLADAWTADASEGEPEDERTSSFEEARL